MRRTFFLDYALEIILLSKVVDLTSFSVCPALSSPPLQKWRFFTHGLFMIVLFVPALPDRSVTPRTLPDPENSNIFDAR